MAILLKDASKKEDKVFRGVKDILALVEKMLSPHPEDRPSAPAVRERLYTILAEHSGLGPPAEGVRGRIHCEARPLDAETDFDFGFDQLRLASQRAAAEACANVNPTATALTQLSLGNGGTIYGVEKVETPVFRGKEGDRMSVSTGKSRSSEGKMSRVGSGSGSAVSGGGKPKPKAKAWQAPVYAGMPPLFLD